MGLLDRILKYFTHLFRGYHIILVPQNRAKTKTFQVSGFSLKILLGCVILSVPLFLVSVLSSIHYQNKMVTLQEQTLENEKLIQAKKELILKLASLEKNLTQIDASVVHLGQVLDIDPQSLQAGLGPVSDSDLYLGDEKVMAFNALNNKETQNLVDEWLQENGEITQTKFHQKLAELKRQSSYLNHKVNTLFKENKDKIRFVNSSPSILPVEGWVTSEFGMRKHPLSRRYKMHNGMDIASPTGTPIKTPADGIVVFTGRSGGYGNVIVIDHGYGISSVMAHCSKLIAELGTKVSRGDIIALVGATGAVSGAHLHYEIRVDGIPADPMQFIAQVN